jgi:hypothetical protein
MSLLFLNGRRLFGDLFGKGSLARELKDRRAKKLYYYALFDRAEIDSSRKTTMNSTFYLFFE